MEELEKMKIIMGLEVKLPLGVPIAIGIGMVSGRVGEQQQGIRLKH